MHWAERTYSSGPHSPVHTVVQMEPCVCGVDVVSVFLFMCASVCTRDSALSPAAFGPLSSALHECATPPSQSHM